MLPHVVVRAVLERKRLAEQERNRLKPVWPVNLGGEIWELLAVPGVVGPEGDHHLARGQRPLLMRVHDEALPNQAPPAVPDCPALHS